MTIVAGIIATVVAVWLQVNWRLFGFKVNDWADVFARGVAWWLPSRIVYWCAIRVFAHATTEQYGNQIVPDLRVVDALNRWPK